MKKIVIDEGRLREIIKEAMGIAMEVNDISQKIELKIFNLIENNIFSGDFVQGDLNVHFDAYNFKNHKEMVEWVEKNGELYKNGYSPSENKLYLTFFSINGNIDTNYVYETVQHEVEHYWQVKKSGKQISYFKGKTNSTIEELMQSNNLYLRYFSKIIYITKKFEIDAYVNGAYSVLCKNKFKSPNEFIENTEIKQLINLYQEYYSWLLDISFKSPTIIMALTECKNAGLINKIHEKKYFLTLIENAADYLTSKIGRAWALYTANPVDKETLKEDFKNPIFRRLIGELNLYEHENNNAGN